MPLALKLGSALSLTREWVVALDASAPRDQALYAALGTEYRWRLDSTTLFSGRLGLDSRAWGDVGGLSGIALGLGGELHGLGLDYAFVPFGSLGHTHRVSLTFGWGGRPAQPAVRLEHPARKESAPAEDSPELHFGKAEALIASQSLEEAKAELRLAADLLGEDDKRRVRYFQQMGQVSFLQNEATSATEFFKRALDLSIRLGVDGPQLAQAYVGMAICLAADRKTAYAVKFYEKALEVGPSPNMLEFVQAQLKKLRGKKR